MTDASWDKLCRLAKKCGFILEEGSKHTIVRKQSREKITTIPRHNKLKKYTAKEIIKSFKEAGCERKELR